MCPEPGQSEEPNGHNVFAGASVERCLPCVVCTVYCLVMYIAVHKPPARAEGRTTLPALPTPGNIHFLRF